MQPLNGMRRLVAPVVMSLAFVAGQHAFATGSGCPSDVDGDGRVSAQDLALLLADWGGSPHGSAATDIDGNGIVDAADLSIMLGAWDTCVAVPAWAELVEAKPDPAVVGSAALRAAIEQSGLAWRVRDRVAGIELLLVPEGAFMMGATPDDTLAFSDEYPAHAVAFAQPFYLGRYEVMQREFEAVMGFNPSYFPQSSLGGDADYPVETVSHDTIAGFLDATGLRLPTEAEWECACRAGTTAPNYAELGQTLDGIAWYGPNSGYITHLVGMKPANALGFHDMLGNVWEWVADWYDAGYYAVSPLASPQGPEWGIFRVIRGGSWYTPESNTRAPFRGAMWPAAELGDTGFRVARSP